MPPFGLISPRALRSHFFCGLCDIEGQTELDDFIEISFSVSPQVRRLALHDVDGLSIEDPHWSWKSPTADGYPADKPGSSCAVLSAG